MRTRLLSFVLASGALGLVLLGCSSFPRSAAAGCQGDAGCSGGERCVEGACEPVPAGGSCLDDADCGNGERCGARACEPDPPPLCVDDTVCPEREHCLDGACGKLVGDPATCPAPSLTDELVCSDWDRDECPCYAGVVTFHEKDEGGRLSCANVVGIFSQFVYLKQTGCHLAALDDQLSGDAVGFGELKLRLANLPNDTSCSAQPDVWTPEGSTHELPAVRITCSAHCTFWMEQFPSPPPERLVPDGSFVRGTPAEQLPPGRTDEAPAHPVDLTCFYMDRFEVSRGQYERCLAVGTCTQPAYAAGEEQSAFFGGEKAGLPMVAVTQQQADAFCKFNEKSLPTEAEWERAARSDPARFEPWPWGSTPPYTSGGGPDCAGGIFAGCGDGPAPASEGSRGGGRGASYFDVADLGGNVREWTRDYYRDDAYERLAGRSGAPPRNPEELRPGALGAVRVVRGGSFLSEIDRSAAPPSDALRVSARDHEPETAALPDLGFRCVRYKPGVAR